MNNKYYVIGLYGGSDLSQHGPFDSFEDRDKEAKKLWAEIRPVSGDNIFWADVKNGELVIGCYIDGDLD